MNYPNELESERERKNLQRISRYDLLMYQDFFQQKFTLRSVFLKGLQSVHTNRDANLDFAFKFAVTEPDAFYTRQSYAFSIEYFEAIATKLLFSELRVECTNLLQASTQIGNGHFVKTI